jgi:hypothetical protein
MTSSPRLLVLFMLTSLRVLQVRALLLVLLQRASHLSLLRLSLLLLLL